MSTNWLHKAACRGLPIDIFFPLKNGGDPYTLAREICSGCSVTQQCLELALRENKEEDDKWGIFGGLDPYERWRERCRRNTEGAANDG